MKGCGDSIASLFRPLGVVSVLQWSLSVFAVPARKFQPSDQPLLLLYYIRQRAFATPIFASFGRWVWSWRTSGTPAIPCVSTAPLQSIRRSHVQRVPFALVLLSVNDKEVSASHDCCWWTQWFARLDKKSNTRITLQLTELYFSDRVRVTRRGPIQN